MCPHWAVCDEQDRCLHPGCALPVSPYYRCSPSEQVTSSITVLIIQSDSFLLFFPPPPFSPSHSLANCTSHHQENCQLIGGKQCLLLFLRLSADHQPIFQQVVCMARRFVHAQVERERERAQTRQCLSLPLVVISIGQWRQHSSSVDVGTLVAGAAPRWTAIMFFGSAVSPICEVSSYRDGSLQWKKKAPHLFSLPSLRCHPPPTRGEPAHTRELDLEKNGDSEGGTVSFSLTTRVPWFAAPVKGVKGVRGTKGGGKWRTEAGLATIQQDGRWLGLQISPFPSAEWSSVCHCCRCECSQRLTDWVTVCCCQWAPVLPTIATKPFSISPET